MFSKLATKKAKCYDFGLELDGKSDAELADLLVVYVFPKLGTYSIESEMLFKAAWRLKEKNK